MYLKKVFTKFTLRNETIEVNLHYPGSWFVEEKPEAYQVSFQNVPFLNNLNELGQELPLTIEKITFMLDPKPTSDIDWITSASQADINGQKWFYSHNENFTPDTNSMTFETRVHDSLFRIYFLVYGNSVDSVKRVDILDSLVDFVAQIEFGHFMKVIND